MKLKKKLKTNAIKIAEFIGWTEDFNNPEVFNYDDASLKCLCASYKKSLQTMMSSFFGLNALINNNNIWKKTIFNNQSQTITTNLTIKLIIENDYVELSTVSTITNEELSLTREIPSKRTYTSGCFALKSLELEIQELILEHIANIESIY